MSDDDFEMIHGSGNVFRDFGEANAEVLQLKAILAASRSLPAFPRPTFPVCSKQSFSGSRSTVLLECSASSIKPLN
jgi:hypothetical protein